MQSKRLVFLERRYFSPVKCTLVGNYCLAKGRFLTNIFCSWNTHQSNVAEGLAQTLKDLQTDYLDLYLVHWPMFVFALTYSPHPQNYC